MITELSFDRPEVLADPYPHYRRLREEAPVHWDTAERAWLVTRYRDVVSLLRDRTLSAQADMSFMDALPSGLRQEAEPLRQHFGAWMVFSDPPLHTRLRSLTQGYLTPQAFAALRAPLERLAARLLDTAEERGRVDALNEYALPLARLALSAVIGIREIELTHAARWSDDLLEFINVEPTVEHTRKALASLTELRRFVRGLGANDSLRPNSLAGTLVRAHADDLLTETEIVATFAQNITGALGPIPHLTSNGLLALLDHPRELARLRGDPSLMPTAIEEFLRYDSPFLLVPRTATQRLFVAGTRIEPGQRVGLMLAAANHDPEIFEDPERLDISRHPNKHLAFGLGVHFCLGAYLTRLVAEVGVSALIRRFSRVALAGPFQRLALFGMRGVETLPLAVAR